MQINTETEKKLNSFISRCRDRQGNVVPSNTTPHDVSKFVFERYVGNSLFNCKIFLYSSEKSGNNKPYTFEKQVSKETAMLVDDLFYIHRIDGEEEDIFAEKENESIVPEPTSSNGF